MSNLQQLIERIKQIGALGAYVHEESTKLMKELEQFSAPLPERGSKKKGNLTNAEIGKYIANRLKQIKS